MKSKKILFALAMTAMVMSPQQTNAQFWKNLGKVAEGVGKAVLNSSSTQTTNSQSASTNKQSAQSTSARSPRYTIHRTAETKTMTLRGGASVMGNFSEGYAIISPDWKNFFVINKKGEKVFSLPDGYIPSLDKTSHQSYEVARFKNGRLLIEKGSDYHKDVAIIDTLGNIIKTFKDVTDVMPYYDGVAGIAFRGSLPWFIDINGNVLSKSINLKKYTFNYAWDEFGLLKDGLRRYKDNTTGKYGYLDAECNIVISPKYKSCGSFSEGLAVAWDDEAQAFGYIDKTGKWVIVPMFTRVPGEFHCGYARVTDKSYKSHYIDKTGKIVWSAGEGEWPDFCDNGYLVCSKAIYNTSFKKVATYDSHVFSATQYDDEWFACKSFNHWAVFDYKGNVLLDYPYTPDKLLSNGIGRHNSGHANDQYYFNLKGEIIIEFKDTQF